MNYPCATCDGLGAVESQRGYFKDCPDCLEKGLCPGCAGDVEERTDNDSGIRIYICVAACGWEDG